MSSAVDRVIARLDRLNAEDPLGREIPFADRLEAWVRRLNAAPSDELRIAARGQHVRRWTVPRGSYPEGRGGYLRWREDLKRMHADTVAEAMRAEGFTDDSIARARTIVMKRDLASHPDAQTIEDALCLVFLETQFEELRSKTPDEKMIDILRKTWRKMSPQGREAALALHIPPQHLVLIQKALAHD